MIISPKLFGIFEFCKKQHIKNFTCDLTAKIQIKNLITGFLKKYFHFSEKPGSFKGRGHFWGLRGMDV